MSSLSSSLLLSSAPRFPNSLVRTPHSCLTVIADQSIYFFPLNPTDPTNYTEMISIHKERVSYPINEGDPKKGNLFSFPLTPYDGPYYFRCGSWSEAMFTFGSLFAVCSTDKKVSTFRAVDIDGSIFKKKWEEVDVISDKLHKFYLETNFLEGGVCNLSMKGTPIENINRTAMLTTNCLAWSPAIKCKDGNYSILALGGVMSVAFWKQKNFEGKIIGATKEGLTQITCMAWTSQTKTEHDEINSMEDCILATGSSDGSVNLWKLSDKGGGLKVTNICCIFAQDLISVWCLIWSHKKDVLYISKNGGVASYSIQTNTLRYNSNLHTNLITSFALDTLSPLLYSISIDGCIKASDSQTLKLVSSLDQFSLSNRSNGTFGISLSPCSLYLTVIEKVKGHTEEMYLSRHANTKFSFININKNFDTALTKIEFQNFACQCWDIIKVLKSEVDLTKIKEAFKILISVHKTHSIIKPLQMIFCICAIMLSKPSLPKEIVEYFKTTSEKFENEIIMDFIEKALTSLQTKKVVTPLECSSARLFCEWISSHTEKPLLVELRKKTLAKIEAVKTPPNLCLFCNEPISLADSVCSNGHPLFRCARTFLLLDSPWILHCDACGRRFKKIPKDSSEFDWIESGSCSICATLLTQLTDKAFG